MPGSRSAVYLVLYFTMAITCDHCREPCVAGALRLEDKLFCREGCKMVYTLLNGHGLKDYYQYNERPGINRRAPVRDDKFAFLDEERIASRLISFRSDTETHIQFYLPQIHCSSCLYLLENLRRLHSGILSCRVDFAARQAFIVFDQTRITLREVAVLLAILRGLNLGIPFVSPVLAGDPGATINCH